MRANRRTRVALSGALFLTVAGLLVLQGMETFRGAARRLGFTPSQGERGVLVEAVAPGLPAERAGLRAKDEILAVEGRPVRSVPEYQAEARSFRRGRAAPLTVSRGREVLTIRAVPGVPPRWGLLAVNSLTSLGYLAIALLILTRSAEDLRVRLLFGFTAAVALEIALPINAFGRPGLTTAVSLAFYLLTGLQIGLELHLASLIPERPPWLRKRRWVVPLYYGTGFGLGLLASATYLSEVLAAPVFPWTSLQADTVLTQIAIPVWALTVAALLTSQALHHPEPRGRHQAGLVLAGTIPWLLFMVSATVLDRLGFPLPLWATALESLVLLGYPICFLVAIFRYHLFDLELVVRRGLVYTLLTGALVLVFYAALGAGGAIFSHLLDGQESVWAVSIATLLLGLLFAPLRRILHRVIDRRFFPERYALRQRLVALAGELPALGKLPRMAEHLAARIEEIFLARSVTLLIAAPETGLLGVLAASPGNSIDPELLLPLDDLAVDALLRARRPLPAAQLDSGSPAFAHFLERLDPATLFVPLLSQEKLIGLLVVGPKQGRRGYPAEEVDLLNLVGHHAATVFENARLFESATYESLTGLLRREAILEQLERELERARRYGRPLTIAMADLDHFKKVNDRHGHLAGDTLLRRISQVVADGLRSTDWIGRYGGEEFLLLLPETDMTGAGTVAEKIRSLVQRTVVPIEGGALTRVTISIGLASLEDVFPRDGKVTARDLIAAADRSLYEAKNGGRNRVHPLVAVA